MIIGYTIVTTVTIAISVVGALAMKALGIAKVAAVVSIILLVAKLFHHHRHQDSQHHIPAYVEIERAPELNGGFTEFLLSGTALDTSGASSSQYSYADYIPPGMVANAIDYSTTETSMGNSSLVGNQQVSNVARRRDIARKTTRIPLVTIHQYTVKS